MKWSLLYFRYNKYINLLLRSLSQFENLVPDAKQNCLNMNSVEHNGEKGKDRKNYVKNVKIINNGFTNCFVILF
jgi:hypothetical protein